MANMDLNIVGTLDRSDKNIRLNEYEKSSEYAEVNRVDEIQMFYKKAPLDDYAHKDKLIWQYLSHYKLWVGSSDDMSKKRLLKLVG